MDNFNFDEDIIEEESKREFCDQCIRPIRTCWCHFLPNPKIKLSKTKVIIIQHPNETKRAIRTAKMLEHGLANEDCLIFVRRKVMTLEIKDSLTSEEKSLRNYLSHPGAHLLFPRKNAITPDQLGSNLEQLILVVLDGTWDEARKMYAWSPALQALPKLTLDLSNKTQSQFVIKTQPNDKCLSTVECVAHTIAKVEGNSNIVDELTKPLLAMCSIQISHGAVKHESKEFKKDVKTFKKVNCRKNKGPDNN